MNGSGLDFEIPLQTTNMGYLFLLLTILAESASVILVKFSKGFVEKPYAIAGILCYAASFVFLSLALRSLPAGIANALWAGTSTVLVVLLGMYFFKESLSAWQWVFLVMIVAGMVGLNYAGK